MVQYRRNLIPGATYFFTVTLEDRSSNFLIRYNHELKRAFNKVKIKSPYITEAFVIMPDHLHVIWKLPEGDSDYASRWRDIKKIFTRELLNKKVSLLKRPAGGYQLWQRNYWEHTIINDNDFENHVNYIHYNPVKHGFVKHVRDWRYSSFHSFVKRSIIDINWGSEQFDSELNTVGE